MSRNPVDRLEAEVGSPKRGKHAAIWQRGLSMAGQPVILSVRQQVGWVAGPHGHALSHFNWEQ
ncbi:TPA: hypothetical protein ACH3X2_000686 [Trebouxia sp. C0005]